MGRVELRELAVRWLPPALVDALRARFGQLRFAGDYASWSEAMASCDGYAAGDILDRVAQAAQAVQEGRAAFERDGVTFSQVQHSWPVLASLLWIAALRGGRLHVLDFGGSLGGSYRQNRSYLASVSWLRWSVVEQANFVARGRAQFEDAQLCFHEDVDGCIAQSGLPDVLLLSSVLPYVEAPYAVLDVLLSRGVEFVIVDRTPLLDGARDRLTVQRVGERLGRASYPAWFFSRAKFLRAFEGKYRLREEFASSDHANIASRYQGFLFARIPATETIR
jgi:putative methyltransferase (TIGR04325 family)